MFVKARITAWTLTGNVDKIASMLYRSDVSVRVMAANVLSEFGDEFSDKCAIEPLLGLLKYDDSYVRTEELLIKLCADNEQMATGYMSVLKGVTGVTETLY